MSDILNKANDNQTAAKLLIENSLYAPSVHCSYYICVQYMKHLALYKFGMTEDTMQRDMNLKRMKGTHKYLISLIMDKIREVDKSAIVDFKSQINGLQKLREKSDYQDEKIIIDESSAALETSKELRKYLKETLA